MSYFLDSVCTIVRIFHKYARCQDGNLALNRREMKTLIQKEFAEVLENPCDPQTIELTFKLLDVNGDSLVDFNEYLIFVFQIATGCYRYLQPREYLVREESSRALREGEAGGSKRGSQQLQDGERRGDFVHERQGSDGTSMEEGRRGELMGRYLPIEPVEEVEEEEDSSFEGHEPELRDGDRRGRPSQERQERDPEQRWHEPEEWEDIEIPEPGKRRQRESALDEDSPRQSRQLVRRNDNDRREARGLLDRDEEDLYSPIVISRREDGRQRRGQETEHQEAQGRLFRHGSQARVDRADYDVERSRPSRERRERQDGRREPELHSEQRSRAFEPRVADERRDRIRHRSPVAEYEEHRPLSREGERRPQFHEADHREGERRRQGRSVFQSREDVDRAIQAEEEEVRRSERRRAEDEWSRPRPREASRRPEVEDLERREQERRRRRPYSSELENMDRPSRSHESEGREEVRRSQRPEDLERRRREFSRDETRATESIRRRPQSQEPELRDPKYDRSQSYEEARRDDQRRPRNYEVRSQERDAERRRRLQPRESPKREDNQERQRYDEHETWDSERDRRRPQLRYSEPREREMRRPQLVDSGVDEREQLQSREAVTRPTQSDRFSPSDSPGEYDRNGQQLYESRHTLQSEGRRQSYNRLSNAQRQIWAIDIAQRESEGQRRSNVEVRDVDQFRGVDRRESEHQRRTSIHDSDDENIDQRQTQTYEVSSREGEDQRRTSSHDSGTRQINQRRSPTYEVGPKDDQQPRRMPSHESVDQRWRSRTQTDLVEDGQKPSNPYEVDPRDGEQQRTVQSSDPNFRDTEVTQDNMGDSTRPREATSLSNQTADRELDLLRDQRPPESGEPQPSRKPGQSKAERSLVSPHEQHQATRESQNLSGPEQRGPQRRWLQRQTEAQEAGVDQVQPKVGSPASKRVLSQPSERQITEGQESWIQGYHPTPAPQAEGQSELSPAGEGDKTQEPAALNQQQVHREGEAPQPEMEEPKVEEDDGSGSWAQESQPPLEDDDQQAIMEKPSSSLVESKSCVICNPLYEYLLAQKKQEQP
ncbi:trichohyalin-like [Ahaetulla prasina]|uniref:trichohyalin-like n=1 Tax=Ahaetulla prasina TaxID=499056 RepID=UPI002648A30D|nr:trichohyalin-like [Ahaetulla prasina]XP_058016494.1 trichohyalin-like [Ahaetulla prasina]